MGIGTRLIACPSCSCHAFARETVCPNCGANLRAADGSLPRTAGAVMLGLTMVTATVNGCSDEPKTPNSGGNGGMGGVMEGSTVISAYGIASTSSAPQGGMGGMGGMGGTSNGGAGGMGPCGMTCADAVKDNLPVCSSSSPASQQLYMAFRECACTRGSADPMAGCKDVCSDNWCAGAGFSANCTMCLQNGACSAEFAACAGGL